MAKVTEVPLPGVGVRQELVTASGQRLAVISYRTGRRELAIYRRDDPDACTTILELDADDTATLASLLGAPQVSATISAMQRVEGLALDWLTVGERGATSIGAGGFRTRTGASIVAVLRGTDTLAAPGPELELVAGDVVVAVGTPDGLAQLGALLRG
jgi:TrkA domain protein